jgi:hypothetical protein
VLGQLRVDLDHLEGGPIQPSAAPIAAISASLPSSAT